MYLKPEKKNPFSKSTENKGSSDRSNPFKILHFYRVQNQSDESIFFYLHSSSTELFFFLGTGILNFYILLMDIKGGVSLWILSGCYHNVA